MSDIGAVPSARPGLLFAAVLVVLVCIYGQVQLRRSTTTPGPRVAVLQQDYPSFTDARRNARQPDAWQRADSYAALLQAASAQKADLYLLPETPWTMALNPEHLERFGNDPDTISQHSYDLLHNHAVQTGAYVVTGAMSIIPTPHSLLAKDVKHNSAFIFASDGNAPQRYDKIHCVALGEQVPFRFGRLRFLYLWLDERMPFHEPGYEYSLVPGNEFKTFSMTCPSDAAKTFGFAVPICYEDVMPYVSRGFVTDPQTQAKRVDFLLNISNDGWFVHSDELPQHLAICAFRAVENRVPIARAVNTGISGFIDSNGRIHDLVTRNGRSHGAGITGFSIATLGVDSRQSLYSRVGDKFAMVCGLLSLLMYLDYVIIRARGSAKPETATGALS